MNRLLVLILVLVGCGPIAIVDQKQNQLILIRSPQPDERDFIELVNKYKIKTVINLRGTKNKDWYKEEVLVTKKLGIQLHSFRLSGRTPPSDKTIEEIFSIIKNQNNWPILIHCQGGIHRTGLIVALYRIRIQKWPAKKALTELANNYFYWTVVDRRKIIEYISQLDDE